MSQTLNFQSLDIEISESDDEAIYTFKGDMNESFDNSKVPRLIKSKITLVLKDLNTFNSVGIREWIKLISDFSHADQLIFKECSLAVIDQVNMVPTSLGKGTIESFYAPYYCECGNEENQLINVEQHLKAISNLSAPDFACKVCDDVMEFDALEESYFQFITEKEISNAS